MDERDNYAGEPAFDIVDKDFAGLTGPQVVCMNHVAAIPANF